MTIVRRMLIKLVPFIPGVRDYFQMKATIAQLVLQRDEMAVVIEAQRLGVTEAMMDAGAGPLFWSGLTKYEQPTDRKLQTLARDVYDAMEKCRSGPLPTPPWHYAMRQFVETRQANLLRNPQ